MVYIAGLQRVRIYKHYKFTLTNDIPLASGFSLPHRGAQDLNNLLCTVQCIMYSENQKTLE